MRYWTGLLAAAALAALAPAPPLAIARAPVDARASGAGARPAPAQPVRVILDTDMWGDIDDVLALAMLHALQDRGEARLLAVTGSTDDASSAAFIAALNGFYGRPAIPVGLVRGGVTAERTARRFPFLNAAAPYTEALTRAAKADGSPLFPRAAEGGGAAPDAVALLRRTLAAQPDGSVVIIQIGFATNLARLLDSGGDAASPLDGAGLVRRKVRLLSVMAGGYADARGRPLAKSAPEYNLELDVPAARALFDRWPTPIVASGFEVGVSMRIDGRAIDRLLGHSAPNPVLMAYHHVDPVYRTIRPTAPGALHDHATFDLTAVLHAVRPDGGYFTLSAPGRISVAADGSSRFAAQPGGTHRYLKIDDSMRPRTLEAMTLLASQPPAR